MSKVVLITGCSKTTGIGYNTALSLVTEGRIVIATVRDKNIIDRLNQEHNGNPIFKYLDLANEKSIEHLVNDVIQEYGKIDTLINNAGYGLIGAVEQLTSDQIRNALEVNVVGTISLIQHVIPHMKNKSHGHIIYVSSIHSARYCQPLRSCYRGSKAFIEIVAEALSFELAQCNINVSLFEPGRLTTIISKEFGSKDIDNSHYQNINEKSNQWFRDYTPAPQTGGEVAKFLVQLVKLDNPPFHFQTGNLTTDYVNQWRSEGKSNEQQAKLKEYYIKK